MTTATERAARLQQPQQRPPDKALEENRPTAEFEARDPDGFAFTIHTIPDHIPAERDLPKRQHRTTAAETEPEEDEEDEDFEPRQNQEAEEEDYAQETEQQDQEQDEEEEEEQDPFDPGDLVGDAMMQLSREDSCFCGTSGELAVRLVAALALAEDPADTKQVFVSYRCWVSDVFPKKIRRKDGSWTPTKDVSQTVANPKTIDRICGSVRWCRVEKSFSVPRGFPVSSCCWVALDGSSCGVGLSRDLWEELSAGFPRPSFQLMDVDPNKLASLVFLASRSGAAVSLSPAADLRLGSFVPGAGLRAVPRNIDRLADCLARAKTPSSLFRLLSAERPPRPFPGELSSFSAPVFVSGAGFVGVGFGADLLPQLPASACWVPLSWRAVWLLFGPPLHLLSPLPWGVVVPVSEFCRLFPDAPHEPEPAHLEETHTEAIARELFATAAPTDWLGEETEPPDRVVGSISAA